MNDILKPAVDISSKKVRYLIYAGIALLVSILQILFLDTIAIGDITPDLLIIVAVAIAVREGQFEGTITGFLIGLFFDIVSFDLIGTNALAKTFVGFFAGYFFKEGFHKATFSNFKFIIIVLFASLINNLLYYLVFIKPMELSFFNFFVKYGLAMAFYTTIFSLFIFIFYSRKRI